MVRLVEFIAGRLVDHPAELSVVQREEEGASIISLRVAQSDLGKVIGKQGRTIRAMRILLAAAQPEGGKDVRLEIIEE